MNMKRNNGGFTLVEFVVTIAIASMITLAATSMLLLGLRIHHKSNTTAATLNTVSMLYSVMDTIASKDTVIIKIDGDSWTINPDSTENAEISYDSSKQAILLNGAAFVNNVSNSTVTKTGNLLTIEIATERDNYSFSIYCRKGVT